MKILFVCSQNTCRSPMAQAIAEHLFSDGGKNSFDSAGINSFGASYTAVNAVKAVKKLYNADFSHRPRTLCREMITESDLVVAVSRRHYDYILYTFGDSIKEKLTVMPFDIPDPFGGSEEAYLFCASELERGIRILFSELGICS